MKDDVVVPISRSGFAASCLAFAVAACGDNLEVEPPEPTPPDECPVPQSDPTLICHQLDAPEVSGPLSSPAAFDTQACGNTPLDDGTDLSGAYTTSVFDFALEACPGGYRLRGLSGTTGPDTVSVRLTSAGVIVRSGNDQFAQAVLFCGDNGDGTFTGVVGFCTGPNCQQLPSPIEPFELERPNGEAEADGLTLLSEHNLDSCGERWPLANYVSHVEVDGTTAFVTVAASGLHIIDVADPASPKTIASIFEPMRFWNDIAIFHHEGRRYVVLAGFDMPIYDVTDPADPHFVARIDAGAHRFDLRVEDDRVLLYSTSATLRIDDLSDPNTPRLVGEIDRAWDLHAPTIAGDKLYLAAGSTGFVVLEDPASDPENPVILGTYMEAGFQYSHHAGIFEVGGKTYAMHNDEIGMFPFYRVIDVTPGSPEFMTPVANYMTTPDQISHNITMVGTTAYLAYYEHGIRVVELDEPTVPRQVAHYHTHTLETATFGLDGVTDIAIDDRGLILAADTPRGLLILERESD